MSTPVFNPTPRAESPIEPQRESRLLGQVAISVEDSPMKTALDMYYSNLIGLVEGKGFGGDQKLLLNNIITGFDISTDTPYFNEGLFRNFADRVIMGSPQNLGPANRADRFSLAYRQVIEALSLKIDRGHPASQADLDAGKRAINHAVAELDSIITKTAAAWGSICAQTGWKPSDPDYELKYISYLEKIRYADQLAGPTSDVDSALADLDAIRRAAYTTSEQLVLDNVIALNSTKEIARPLRPQFERTYPHPPVGDVTFADPNNRVEAICDISPYAFPMNADLVKFLQVPGQKSWLIKKTDVATHQHDSSWSGHASGSYMFFSASVGASGSSSFKQTISTANSIEVGFENIDEVLVDRDLWFNPSVFADPALKKVIDTLPGAARLQYVSVSLVIARGLKISLSFDTVVDTTSWSKKNFDASGGVGVFGYSFGGSASYSTYDYSVEHSQDLRTISFIDDPLQTRVLAIRLDPFVEVKHGLIDFKSDGSVSHRADPALVTKYKDFVDGKISYLELQAAKFK